MDTALNPNNYPTYNVGDEVTIRQWEDMKSEFGLNRYGAIKTPQVLFTESMKQYCGQTLPIVHIDPYSPSSFFLIFIISAVAERFLLPSCLNNLIPQLSPPLSPLMIC